MLSLKPPVVVITYNRSDLLSNLLKCLKKDKVPLLYIFSDGPKDKYSEREVMQVRQTIKNEANWCETIVYERDTNFGLGKSVMNGISTVLKKHESLILFEDDLAFIEGTYHYLSTALNHYKDVNKVTSITAWTHPMITPEMIKRECFFDGKSECWGVGLWRRSWKGMEVPVLEMVQQCREKGIDVKKYGSDMLLMAEESVSRNRWAVNFWYNQILKGGLCLRPPYSLVEHYGWDNRATTANNSMLRWANPPLKQSTKNTFNFPESIEEHPDCAMLWKKAIGY